MRLVVMNFTQPIVLQDQKTAYKLKNSAKDVIGTVKQVYP